MEEKDKKKTVRVFTLASFLNDFGSDMIYPVWPLFVRMLGANMAMLGFIDGLGEAVVSISQAVSGYISDKIKKRKIFIWTGYLCGSVSRIGYAISTVWKQLIFFKILDRAGKMRGAPRDAIIADISTKEDRGRNFGLLRMMDHLGAVCGILTCIFLFNYIGFKNLFLIAAIPSAIAVLLILIFIKEVKAPGVKAFKGLALKDLNRDFKLFLLLNSFFAIGSFSYSFLLIFAKESGFKIAFVPALYLLFTVTASITSLPFGMLSDIIGRKSVMYLSFIFWALVCLIFIFARGYISILLSFIIYGLHKGALEPVQKTFVSELSPEQYKASGLGGFQMVISLCALPASLIAGLLWDKMGMAIPFYFSLGLTILSIILLLFVKEK